MKTIIRKNGQKFNITDALYESIIRKQLIEDNTATPPAASSSSKTSKYKDDVKTTLVNMYGDKIRQALINNNIPKDKITDELISNIAMNLPQNDRQVLNNIPKYVQEYIQKLQSKNAEELKNYIIGYMKKSGYDLNNDYADDMVNQIVNKVIENNYNKAQIDNLLDSIIKDGAENMGIPHQMYSAAKENLKKEIADRLERIKKVINAPDSPIDKFNNVCIKQIKSMIDDDDRDYSSINIPKSVISLIFNNDSVSKLLDNISDDIIKYFYNEYKDGEEYSGQAVAPLMKYKRLDKDEDTSTEKISENEIAEISKFMDTKIYDYVYKKLSDKDFIATTVKDNKEIPEEWIKKTFFPNLIGEMRYIILGDRYNTQNISRSAIPTETFTDAFEEDKKWQRVSEELSDEKGMNDLDESIIDGLKTLVSLINLFEWNSIQRFITYPVYNGGADNIRTESANSNDDENGSNNSQMDTQMGVSLASVSMLKNNFYDLYNLYRKKLYDETLDILENISLDKNLISNMEKEYKAKKEDIDKMPPSFTNIKEIMKNLGIDKFNYLNEDHTPNVSSDEKTDSKLYNKLFECLKTLFKYSISFTKDFSSFIKFNNKKIEEMTGLDISKLGYKKFIKKMEQAINNGTQINDMDISESTIKNNINIIKELFENDDFIALFKYIAIIKKILEKYEEKMEKEGINLDSNLYENSDEMTSFYNLMGRYPDRTDYESYRETLKLLNNKISKMQSNMKLYETLVRKAGYSEYSVLIEKCSEIPYRIINSILGPSLEKSSDFLVKCLAYKELAAIAKNEKGKYKEIVNDIIGDTGDYLTDEKIGSLFYNVIIINKSVSANDLMSILRQKAEFSKKYSFDVSYIANKIYTSQPLIMIDKSDDMFGGCVVFTKYESLKDIFGGVGSFLNTLKSGLKSIFGATKSSKHWMG